MRAASATTDPPKVPNICRGKVRFDVNHLGVRIVEFESNDLELHGQRLDAEVELWDCGGDIRFEKCWPAIRANCDGK